MQRFFVDTSAWYALLDNKDPDHAPVTDTLKTHEKRLITTNFIFDETLTLVRYRLGWSQARAFGQACLRGTLAQLIRLRQQDENEAWQIFQQYDDKMFSFTDCTSFAVMRRFNIETAIATDDDFRRFGFLCLP